LLSKAIKKPCVVIMQLLPSWLLDTQKASFLAFYKHFRQNRELLRALIDALAAWSFVLLLKKCNLIFHSEAYARTFLDIVGPNVKSYVNHHLCSIHVPEMRAHVKDIDAIFVGTHDERKGIFDLVRVWSEVCRRNPQARLVTCGYVRPEIEHELSLRIKEQALAENLQMLGQVDDTKKFEVLNSAKLFILLSKNESFSLVIGEAMARGLPVVAYDLPALREIWTCSAFFVRPIGDIEGIVNEVMTVLSLPNEERKALATVARERASNYSWQSMLQEEKEIYGIIAQKH